MYLTVECEVFFSHTLIYLYAKNVMIKYINRKMISEWTISLPAVSLA
jgi:hypothetical protein